MSKKSFGFIKGLIPTFLGVFLAFILNDFWVDRQEAKLIHKLLVTLEEEVFQNLEQAQQQLDYHKVLQDSAEHAFLAYINKEPGAGNYVYWKGIGANQFKDAAYLTTISTQKLANLNLELANAIAAAYSAQNNYNSILESARDALLGREWGPYLGWINYIRWTAANISDAEKKVVATHERVLEMLKQELS